MSLKPSILFFICFCTLHSYAQTNNNQHSNLYLGPGIGLDYGGLGVRAEFGTIKNFSIIGGLGYNLFSIPGMNAGISYKLYEHKRSAYHISAIYGYNAVIRIKYDNSLDSYTDVQAYYGPSAGAGCDIYDKRKKNKLSVELWVPFRNSDFRNRHEGLKDMGLKFQPDILPVTFSIGYNFSVTMNKNKKTL
jgi:hypothetical protein